MVSQSASGRRGASGGTVTQTRRDQRELTGVSRTSLREARHHLQAEGLVESSVGRGLRVAVLAPEVVVQLYDNRAARERPGAGEEEPEEPPE